MILFLYLTVSLSLVIFSYQFLCKVSDSQFYLFVIKIIFFSITTVKKSMDLTTNSVKLMTVVLMIITTLKIMMIGRGNKLEKENDKVTIAY